MRPGEDQKWRAQQDLRTLQDADAIRKDAERLAAAKQVAQEQMASLKDMADEQSPSDTAKGYRKLG